MRLCWTGVQGLPGPDNGLSPKQQAQDVQVRMKSVLVVLTLRRLQGKGPMAIFRKASRVPSHPVACMHAQDALLEDMVSSVDIIDLKAIHTSVTGPDGFAEVPIQASAGRVLKVVVAAAPEEHLLPHYLKVSGARREGGEAIVAAAVREATMCCPTA